MTECEVVSAPPEVAGIPNEPAEITGAIDLEWRTPGVILAEQLIEIDQVRGILEKIDAEGYTVFVLLSDDPDEVLDMVFAAEQSLYERFRKTPFDVRVIREDPEWDIQSLVQSTVRRFLKNEQC